MSEKNIDEIKTWVNRQRQLSLEGTLLLFIGLIIMFLGMASSNDTYNLSWTTGGGFLFLGGILYINLNKLTRFR